MLPIISTDFDNTIIQINFNNDENHIVKFSNVGKKIPLDSIITILKRTNEAMKILFEKYNNFKDMTVDELQHIWDDEVLTNHPDIFESNDQFIICLAIRFTGENNFQTFMDVFDILAPERLGWVEIIPSKPDAVFDIDC